MCSAGKVDIRSSQECRSQGEMGKDGQTHGKVTREPRHSSPLLCSMQVSKRFAKHGQPKSWRLGCDPTRASWRRCRCVRWHGERRSRGRDVDKRAHQSAVLRGIVPSRRCPFLTVTALGVIGKVGRYGMPARRPPVRLSVVSSRDGGKTR